jgi:thiaminase
MKNLTITLDEKTAAWIRVYAARQGMSVSRFVGELLNERMAETRTYNQALRNFLAQKPFEFEFIDGRRPTREELHDRSGLR